MGNCKSKIKSADYKVTVVTGDYRGAGTDADVTLTIFDSQGQSSPALKLHSHKNNFERGQTDVFYLKLPKDQKNLEDTYKIMIYRNDEGCFASWYLQCLMVHDIKRNTDHVFPVNRWIKGLRNYYYVENDTCLPQDDTNQEQRKELLKEKKSDYFFTSKAPGLPVQTKNIPEDEMFSCHYTFDIDKRAAQLLLTSKVVKFTSHRWETLDDIKTIYCNKIFGIPRSVSDWESDEAFARQRTHGCSFGLIRLCTSVPDKFGVTDEMVTPFTEELTLQKAIAKKRLFIVDLEILRNLKHNKDFHLCAPIALFYERSDKVLVPIAIQLEQDKGDDNPIFLPSDSKYKWMAAKMWYNNADAVYHQSCTHLGFTHLVMEGICVSANRHLSQSHPIYRLLAPHFLYLIAINSLALESLICPGGWVDKTMTCGREGMFDLISRKKKIWRVDVEGTIPVELEKRGVLDSLSNFPYRDDALLLYDVIKRYVTKTIEYYYDTPEKVTGDWELQAWRHELVLDQDKGGVGIKGVPGDDGFTSTDEIVTLTTCIISTCSLIHSAANFPQYDEYAFPPNYPSCLHGSPPKSKEETTEGHIIEMLPDKQTTLNTVVITKLLSERGTKPLGDFEINYVYDPPATKILDEFRKELSDTVVTIENRNQTRNPPYTMLNPLEVPNAISI